MFPCNIIPVLVINDAAHAQSLGESLVTNGLPVAEVTMRTPAALDSIRIMSQIDGLITGAGTVLTVDHAKAAIDAGASFLVSPGLNEAVISYAHSVNIPIIPGVVTATEIGKAIDLGLSLLKLFPAEAVGGANLLKAYTSVYPDIKFMPTGGVSLSNVNDYLQLSNVLACGGSWMAPAKLIDNQDWEQINQLVKDASKLSNTQT